MDKLRSCPFCGGEAELIKIPVSPYPDKYYVRCSNQNDCKVAAHTYMGGTAEEAIEDWNRRAEMNEWVSVKDKLPEESGTYLVSGKHPDSQAQVWVCSFLCLGIASGWVNSSKNPVVSFWMPLPEPPEEET